jgi:hypothetical protein
MPALLPWSLAILAAAGQANPQQSLVVGARAGVILNPVKPDRTADFEAVIAQLRTALESTTDPVRKQQAQGWKIYRAEEGMGKNALYVFLLDPAVPGADYSMRSILQEALPASDAEAALRRIADSLGGTQVVLNMRLVAGASRAPSIRSTPLERVASERVEHEGVSAKAESRLLKTLETRCEYAWTVTMTNAARKPVQVTASLDFQDRDGASVASGTAPRRSIPAGGKILVNGTTWIDKDSAPRVETLQLSLRTGR